MKYSKPSVFLPSIMLHLFFVNRYKRFPHDSYSCYCTSTELVVVPEPYRTLIKFLRQNTQKLFDRNLR